MVDLFIPANNTLPKMVIEEDKRNLVIAFDLSVDFQLDNDLGAGNVGEGAGSTNVDSYVEACKCDGVQSFTCDSSPLLPNRELFVCIKSMSPDVEIDTLNSMVSLSFSSLVIFCLSCQSSKNYLALYCRL